MFIGNGLFCGSAAPECLRTPLYLLSVQVLSCYRHLFYALCLRARQRCNQMGVPPKPAENSSRSKAGWCRRSCHSTPHTIRCHNPSHGSAWATHPCVTVATSIATFNDREVFCFVCHLMSSTNLLYDGGVQRLISSNCRKGAIVVEAIRCVCLQPRGFF